MRGLVELATQSRVCAKATPTSSAGTVTSMLLTVASTAAFVASTAVLLTGLAELSGLLCYFTQDSTSTTTKPTEESIGSALPSSYFTPSLSSSSFSIGGSAWASSGGGGSRSSRQPSCEASDDPDYTCLLSRPPGAFDDEFKIYLSSLSGGHEKKRRGGTSLLNVKLVVPGVANAVAKSEEMVARNGVWASLGFSPSGRMAGPSEAIVGVVGGEESDQGPGVLRYRMDGYNSSSVTPLCNREQVLIGATVDTSTDGSLIVRFSRPFSAPSSLSTRELHCRPPPNEGEDEENEGVGGGGNEASDERVDRNRGTPAELCPAPDGDLLGEEESNNEIGLAWLDPRDEGVVVLWAYGSRVPWPSYHEATGSFVLPILHGV